MQKNTIAIGSPFFGIVNDLMIALRATYLAKLDFIFPEFRSSRIFEFHWTFQISLCSSALVQ